MRLLQAMGRYLAHAKIMASKKVREGLFDLLENTAQKSKEELLRWAALRALAGATGLTVQEKARVRKLLLKAGKDPDPRVRVEAMKALAEAKDPASGRVALFCALQDPWTWARIQCFRVLAKKCPRGAGKHLLTAWKLGAGPSNGVLLYTMTACKYTGAKKLLEQVLDQYKKNHSLAAYAARFLPDVGDHKSASKLLKVAGAVVKDAYAHSRKEALFLDVADSLMAFWAKVKKSPGSKIKTQSLRDGMIALSNLALKDAKTDKVRLALIRLVSSLCPGPDVWKSLRGWTAKKYSPAVRHAADEAIKRCASN